MVSIAGYLKRRLAGDRRLSRLLPDEVHARWQHELRLGRTPDLVHPATFNEKLLWLKLRRPEPGGARFADKLAVRGYVEERCGPELLNEVLAVYERVEDIDLSALPSAFALKPTHSSGENVICQDKSALDWPRARSRLRRALARDFYWTAREPVYRGIPRRILCERFLGRSGETIPDYKFFCFGGVPRIVQVDLDRFERHARAMFDVDWKPLEFAYQYRLPDRQVPRPSRLEEMRDCAARLAERFPFVRVDLYQVGERVVFGELTFYPEGGFGKFSPEAADRAVGELLQLPGPG